MTNGFFAAGIARGAASVRAEGRAEEGLALQRRGLDLEERRVDISRATLDEARKRRLFEQDDAIAKRSASVLKAYEGKRAAFRTDTQNALKEMAGDPDRQRALLRGLIIGQTGPEESMKSTAGALGLNFGASTVGWLKAQLANVQTTAGATAQAERQSTKKAAATIAERQALVDAPKGELSSAQQRFLTTGEFPGNVQFETFIEGDERITATVDENGNRDVIARSPISEDKFFKTFIAPILRDIQTGKTPNESQQDILDIYMKKSVMEQMLGLALGVGVGTSGFGRPPLDQDAQGQNSFSDMSPEELAKVDLSTLTPQQRTEFGAALDDKGF